MRVDHFGVIDFAGFQQMVHSVGGIAAIRNGTVASYVVAHPSTGLGATPS